MIRVYSICLCVYVWSRVYSSCLCDQGLQHLCVWSRVYSICLCVVHGLQHLSVCGPVFTAFVCVWSRVYSICVWSRVYSSCLCGQGLQHLSVCGPRFAAFVCVIRVYSICLCVLQGLQHLSMCAAGFTARWLSPCAALWLRRVQHFHHSGVQCQPHRLPQSSRRNCCCTQHPWRRVNITTLL